jgi:hypothetical protein
MNYYNNAQHLDAFVCVHRRDVGYLLETVLRSFFVNFKPRRNLMLVTNDLPHLQAFIDRMGWGSRVYLSSDNDWLSKDELELPGWYRQQVIKLRAHEFCETANFCNLGADTLMLQPVTMNDMTQDGLPVTYYTRHMPPDNHWLYEWMRVSYVARILHTKPTVSRRYVDFINDLFCFNRQEQIDLNRYLQKLYGQNTYYNLLRDMGTDPRNMKKFGEWTLYTMYALDVVKRPATVRNTRAGFLSQVHSLRSLGRYNFDTKVVHFVGKNFDVDYIKSQIIQRDFELGKHLVVAR